MVLYVHVYRIDNRLQAFGNVRRAARRAPQRGDRRAGLSPGQYRELRLQCRVPVPRRSVRERPRVRPQALEESVPVPLELIRAELHEA